MKGFRLYVVAAALMATLIGANQSVAGEKPQHSGFRADYSKLKPNSDTGMIYNYTYVKPNSDFSGYQKFLIDAITIFPNTAAQFKGINANDAVLFCAAAVSSVPPQNTPGNNQKIPQQIVTPDTGETRIGTLDFKDGASGDALDIRTQTNDRDVKGEKR